MVDARQVWDVGGNSPLTQPTNFFVNRAGAGSSVSATYTLRLNLKVKARRAVRHVKEVL